MKNKESKFEKRLRSNLIRFLMSSRQLQYKDLAQEFGITTQFVWQVTSGVRRSARIERELEIFFGMQLFPPPGRKSPKPKIKKEE